MGKLDLPLDLGTGMQLNLPSDVYLIASAAQLERLEVELGANQASGLTMVPLNTDQPVPAEIIAAARILVIEVDPASPASLNRVAQVRAARAQLPLIVALENASVALVRTLIRQGVSDVVSLPFSANELISQLLDIGASRAEDPDHGLAPMISVICSSSGGGATTAITHLAAALVEESGTARSCCLIDLDLQFGEVAAYLGQAPNLTAIDLLEAGDRLDAELMRNACRDTGRGFSIIGAPRAIAPLEIVEIDQLLRLLEIARREFDLVLLDLPANWTNWTLSAVLACNEIVLLTEQTLSGLRQAKRMLAMFASVGVEKNHIRLVVNRVEKRLFQTISVKEVSEALGHEVSSTIAADPVSIQTSQDQGLLAWEVNKRTRFANDIHQLAAEMDFALTGAVS